MAEPPSESLLTRKMEGRDARDGVKGAEVVLLKKEGWGFLRCTRTLGFISYLPLGL
jgi:hypothetical protein